MTVKTIKAKLKKDLKSEIDYYVDNFDVEGVIERYNIKDTVNREIKSIIVDSISKHIRDFIFKELTKKFPYIDGWLASNVEGFVLGFDAYCKKLIIAPPVEENSGKE